MKTSDLFQNKQDCCGCELCSIVCPRHIIEMQEDEEGFLYPHIADEASCINCKRCVSVCPEKSPGRNPNSLQSSYGGFVNDTEFVKLSSSGGFATAIGQAFVKDGGIVYGVEYSSDWKSVSYSRADNVEALEKFRTSKYAQAHKKDVYGNVQKDLKEGKKVLFVGLPCEVSALYHFVRDQENLYTVSLICHGPTSQKVHRQFCENLIKENGAGSIEFMTLRHKKKGWQPYYLVARFNNGAEYEREYNKTEYNAAFQYLKRPSCSACQYKLGNKEFGLVADLVLGDYHAVNKSKPEYNNWGVSQATVLSPKGDALMAMLKNQATLLPIDQQIIETTNIALRAPIPQKKFREQFSSSFSKKGLQAACNHPLVLFELKKRRIVKRLKEILVITRNKLLHR